MKGQESVVEEASASSHQAGVVSRVCVCLHQCSKKNKRNDTIQPFAKNIKFTFFFNEKKKYFFLVWSLLQITSNLPQLSPSSVTLQYTHAGIIIALRLPL